MADINAVDLTAETLSSLDGTENVVGFDTAEGKKIPISVLADYVMQKKTQSIAGATQTPKAAVDALNSNSMLLHTGTVIAANTDLNTLTAVGSYYCNATADVSTLTNRPSGLGQQVFRMFVMNGRGVDGSSTNFRHQIIFDGHNNDIYMRCLSNATLASQTWSAWQKLPTRAEIDAVSTVQTVTFTPDTSAIASHDLILKKVGKIMTVNGFFTLKNANVNNLTCGTIPSGSRPGGNIRIPAIVASAAYEVGVPAYIVIGTSGDMKVTTTDAYKKVVYLSASYVIEN